MTNEHLTSEQVISFFNQKWNKCGCPFCGSNDWAVAKTKEGRLFLTHSPFSSDIVKEPGVVKMGRITDSNTGRNDFVTFVVVRCEHCKYTAYFDYEAIRQEVSDND